MMEDMRKYAVETFKVIGASGVARIDFLIDDKNKKIFVNEINTIPGDLSSYLWMAKKVNEKELIENLIKITIDETKKKNTKTYAFKGNLLERYDIIKSQKLSKNKDKKETKSPENRPEYVYQIPLTFIPGLGKKTIDKLLDNFRTEMNILHTLSKDDLEAVVGEKIADNIISAREEIPNAEVCVLSGPSHAEEVGRGIPTTVVVGAKNKETAEMLQDVFMNKVFRVYTSSDIVGIELGGALKNVIALAAGTVDGLGYGDNTKAALMTRGIAELTRLGEALGGKPETFSGLTGVGDLIVTCTSVHSRNRKAGYLMGKGMTADEAMKEVKMVVEGVYSAKAALGLAKKCNVSVPIVEAVNRVLFENADPKEEVSNLLLRERKQEHTNLEWD